MRIALCHLRSNGNYSQSRYHDEPKLEKEHPDDYDRRTWREHGHYDEQGRMYIPGVQFKNAIMEAAKYLGEKIPGKGQSTWTKHFTAGVMVPGSLTLPYTRETVPCWAGMLNADGVRGSGKRVCRMFPQVPTWSGVLEVYVVDALITREVFERYLAEAGNLIGIGRWRPRNGGCNGRFTVERVQWKED